METDETIMGIYGKRMGRRDWRSWLRVGGIRYRVTTNI
jgi:NADH:ubiquinone oxidoreductase subunit D